ncbi:MAG: hypothetical protein LBJ92_01890 [Holosporales bacterium]|jgi:hypothetical protein|nr:hypothetical protein [Holosporales bacterium]
MNKISILSVTLSILAGFAVASDKVSKDSAINAADEDLESPAAAQEDTPEASAPGQTNVDAHEHVVNPPDETDSSSSSSEDSPRKGHRKKRGHRHHNHKQISPIVNERNANTDILNNENLPNGASVTPDTTTSGDTAS